MKNFLPLLIFALLASSGFAADRDVYTPEKGSEVRKGIMEGLRQHFSSNIIFVVDELQVRGRFAFAAVSPQSRDGSRKLETQAGLLYRRPFIESEDAGQNWIVLTWQPADEDEYEDWWNETVRYFPYAKPLLSEP